MGAWGAGLALLARSVAAFDYEGAFLEGVAVERLMDYDGDHEFLDVASDGLPRHRYDAAFGAVAVDLTIDLQKPADYRARGRHFGGAALDGRGPVGVAANGVLIYASGGRRLAPRAPPNSG